MTATMLALAFRWAPRLPEPLVRALAALAADAAWLVRGKGVRRLEANLARVRPGTSRRGLRRLSRAGMRSYLRYYAEMLAQPALSEAQVDARVRIVNDAWIREEFAAGRSVVAALGHLGNWDLAGAWACRNLAPTTTVAERLEPEQVFQNFLTLRESAGMRIVPLGRGEGSQVFRALLQDVRAGGRFLPLLADRDLSHSGVEVRLFGHRARVAPGPAALTGHGKVPLCAVAITYERLYGERRRQAGAPWGIRIVISDPIVVDDALTGRARVQAATQAWVDGLAQGIAAAPQDWHMLQRLFVTDLDPARDAQVAAQTDDDAHGET
ncbi:MAG: phosphatidylinositol mannoside acyltransferase [Cellulomonas sp.]|nr:phosphatidylinositol mannoside acyltransferase [Cellulomonas sp.]